MLKTIQVAESLGVDRRSVCRWVAKGRLPVAERRGRSMLFDPAAVWAATASWVRRPPEAARKSS
jgi:excisionase family DNA binding protein